MQRKFKTAPTIFDKLLNVEWKSISTNSKCRFVILEDKIFLTIAKNAKYFEFNFKFGLSIISALEWKDRDKIFVGTNPENKLHFLFKKIDKYETGYKFSLRKNFGNLYIRLKLDHALLLPIKNKELEYFIEQKTKRLIALVSDVPDEITL